MKLSEILKKYGDCEVKDEVADLIERSLPKDKWKPQLDEVYYYVSDSGLVTAAQWNDGVAHKYRFNHMRIFKTRDEAKRYLEIMTAFQEASFEPDWDDGEQEKMFLTFNKRIKSLDTISRHVYAIPERIFYFDKTSVIRELFNRFSTKDIVKYMFGIELED